MLVNGVPTRTIYLMEDNWRVAIIDQTKLPHQFEEIALETLEDACHAIAEMQVRGAPLIGATAAYGLCLAMHKDSSDAYLQRAYDALYATRPTAVNLRWALDDMLAHLSPLSPDARREAAYARAHEICEDDVATNSAIGDHGARFIQQLWESLDRPDPFHILTHCNAGWLATVDWGTALSPIYKAHAAGIPVHVWVDETRPRNQGASLTAWELQQQGIPHHVIVDNAGGHLMQHKQVHFCIVGTDRTTADGDVCNKVGTYLKALAARDNMVPFYVALPGPTIDWTLSDGLKEIPIEERNGDEVTHIQGINAAGDVVTIQLTPAGTPASNPAFDVTPARLVSGLITERGVCPASRDGLEALYPEHRQ